ncbi:MAG: heat-inducible transcription repressor HrcA [Deltaproteobacteria bacterium]|nr:heat-inducible transcription repressor HrcA [Deltaproteobacteria bacterium]
MIKEIQHRLNDRYGDVLDILISDYISSAGPVGSRTISKKYSGHLSPATIRNVMADLTEMGLLKQPHTSAGRVPTSAGMRYYVDSLLKNRELSGHEMEVIRERCAGDEKEIGAILGRTSRMLATVSHYAGLVVTPSAERVIFKQIQFVPLSSNRILGIFVSRDGMVQNRLLEVNENLSYADLERISNYCNSAFMGLTLDDALDKVGRELEAEYVEYDRLVKKAMIFSKEVLDHVPKADLVVDGQFQLLDLPEFSESIEFRKVVKELEEKKKILHILERCQDGEGVKIFIGMNSGDRVELDSISLVGAPYKKDGKIVGTLGVIGPMRMDYSRVVPIVDFTAKVLGDVLEA